MWLQDQEFWGGDSNDSTEGANEDGFFRSDDSTTSGDADKTTQYTIDHIAHIE